MTNRRAFLLAAAPFALGLGAFAPARLSINLGQLRTEDIPLAIDGLLKLVNEERAQFHLSQLKLDELACQVAGEHARDMANRQFLSHWGSDGRKPYHRYSLAGGVDAVMENVSAADGIQSLTASGIAADLSEMHRKMFNEVSPDDGHRRTILFPHHTHVGLGIGRVDRYLRLDELYLTRYVEVDPVPRHARPKAGLLLRGRLLNPRHELTGADVYYEPLPEPPAIDWLRTPRSYGMPRSYQRLLPRLPDGKFYSDGSTGSIELITGGSFRVPVVLAKDPGINIIVVWLSTNANGSPFPAAQVCIRCE